jgi:hypothetical protein
VQQHPALLGFARPRAGAPATVQNARPMTRSLRRGCRATLETARSHWDGGPLYATVLIAYLLGGVMLDPHVDEAGQLAIGVATCVVLVLALLPLTPERRFQALLVIVLATCMEVVGSILWGVYTYRLHNLPLFVPPGHGLVYLAGSGLTEARFLAARGRAFLASIAVAAAGWSVAGLTLLPRLDASGAIGTTVFLLFLVAGRSRRVYGGVFVVVALLEIAGTAGGAWGWRPAAPGLGIPSGNPPSGAASGYVLFDIGAIALSGRILRWLAASQAALVPRLAARS